LKTLILGLLVSTPAFAAPLLHCSDDQTSVTITRRANGSLFATVSMESVGGSSPAFHYNVIGQSGAFVGKSFTLTVNRADQGTLKVQNLGIDTELDCR
jgi:hypothetical protein